jgi:hypothetical protein
MSKDLEGDTRYVKNLETIDEVRRAMLINWAMKILQSLPPKAYQQTERFHFFPLTPFSLDIELLLLQRLSRKIIREFTTE